MEDSYNETNIDTFTETNLIIIFLFAIGILVVICVNIIYSYFSQ